MLLTVTLTMSPELLPKLEKLGEIQSVSLPNGESTTGAKGAKRAKKVAGKKSRKKLTRTSKKQIEAMRPAIERHTGSTIEIANEYNVSQGVVRRIKQQARDRQEAQRAINRSGGVIGHTAP